MSILLFSTLLITLLALPLLFRFFHRKRKERLAHLALARAYNRLAQRSRLCAEYELFGLRVLAIDPKRKVLLFLNHQVQPGVEQEVALGAIGEVYIEEGCGQKCPAENISIVLRNASGAAPIRLPLLDVRTESLSLREDRLQAAHRWVKRIATCALQRKAIG